MFIAQRSALVVGVIVLMGAAFAQRGVGAVQNPRLQSTAFDGQALFKTYCATCHGASGKGDGPFTPSLRKRPPDLTQLTKLNQATFPAERVTKAIDGRDAARPHGPVDMPVWGDAFTRTTHDNDPESVRRKIEALVKFVESLQERPSID